MVWICSHLFIFVKFRIRNYFLIFVYSNLGTTSFFKHEHIFLILCLLTTTIQHCVQPISKKITTYIQLICSSNTYNVLNQLHLPEHKMFNNCDIYFNTFVMNTS